MKPFVVLEPWIRRSPADWRVVSLHRMSTLQEEVNAMGNAPLLSLSSSGELTDRDATNQPPSPDYLFRYGLVRPGDLVVNPMWLAGGGIGVSNRYGAVSPEYRIYRLRGQVHPRYVHHLVRSDPYLRQYRLLVRADTTFDRRVTKEDFRELPVLVPPIQTQRVIADFLDTETARIAALITKKQRMIELSAARLQSLTDEIIGHSPVVPLGHLANVQMSNVDKFLLESQQTVRLCNYVDVYRNDRITDDLPFMTASASPEQIDRLTLRAGDVIITKDSETADDIGVPAFVPNELPGVVCGYHLALLRAHRRVVHSSYLFWTLQSPFVQRQFAVAATGVTRFGLRADVIRSVGIPMTDLSSQAVIADRLWRQADCSRSISMTLQHQINLLSERKQALITAAVTGELEVPEVAA